MMAEAAVTSLLRLREKLGGPVDVESGQGTKAWVLALCLGEALLLGPPSAVWPADFLRFCLGWPEFWLDRLIGVSIHSYDDVCLVAWRSFGGRRS